MIGPVKPFVAGAPSTPRQDHCPGASLRVNRDEYHSYRRGGVCWCKSADDFEIPHDGRGDARVRCNDFVERVFVKGQETTYGLCHSCGVLENNHRSGMRAMAKMQNGNGGGR